VSVLLSDSKNSLSMSSAPHQSVSKSQLKILSLRQNCKEIKAKNKLFRNIENLTGSSGSQGAIYARG